MKLELAHPFRSIEEFPSIEIPSFTLISGINGVGKTHLLNAINSGHITVVGIESNRSDVRYFDWNNLIPDEGQEAKGHDIANARYHLWSQLAKEQHEVAIELLKRADELGVDKAFFQDLRCAWQADVAALKSFLAEPTRASTVYRKVRIHLEQAATKVEEAFGQNDANRAHLIERLRAIANVPLIALDERAFLDSIPLTWTIVDPFKQSFSQLFVGYQEARRRNLLQQSAKAEGIATARPMSNEEFLERYLDPPWDIVNEIFEAAGLDFGINQPELYEDLPYTPQLTKKSTGARINFGSLSSGERILMSLGLCLYHAEDTRQISRYPKLLLFDEIDAPLHPSMSLALVNTVQEILVKTHGVQVIMTTHSPSTVAVAPDESLFVMKPNVPGLQQVSKDEALNELTFGVPTISISHDGRRQVFVESKNDARLYEKLYQRIKHRLVSGRSLTFIDSGSGAAGNKEQVQTIVGSLVQSGNKTVYGLIDWDLENRSNDRIFVLAEGRRYSIENCIFDPLLVGALLFRERCVTREELSLRNDQTQLSFPGFEDERLQRVVDFVVSKLQPSKVPSAECSPLVCKYLNGRSVAIPRWYLQMKGHSLEESLKTAYPRLHRYRQEAALKNEMVDKIIDELPDLIPVEIVEVFQGLLVAT